MTEALKYKFEWKFEVTYKWSRSNDSMIIIMWNIFHNVNVEKHQSMM